MTDRGSLARRVKWSLELTRAPWQRRFPFRPREVVLRVQSQRVERMAAYAYAHVPYYRETMRQLGLRPSDFRTAADLARLPILDRESLQRDPEYFVSDTLPIDGYVKLRTSATSGQPVTIFRDPAAMFALAAYAERWRAVFGQLNGKRFRYRAMTIVTPTSAANLTDAAFRRLTIVPQGLRVVRGSLSLYDPPAHNLEAINGFRPDVIASYGSYIEALFRHVHETGAPFHAPKVVVYSGDALPDAARRLIEEEFGIDVLSLYGAMEAPGIGFECPENLGHHHNLDLCPIRIVDPADAELPAGESGDVIVSNLINRGTVLLNYRLGDLAAKLPIECPCGRSLPLLSFIEGRRDDWLGSRSGQLVHPQAAMRLVADEPDVFQVQMVQETLSHFRLSLVARADGDREALRARLSRKFVECFGEGTTNKVAFVDPIPRTPSGKVRAVISLAQEDDGGVPSPGGSRSVASWSGGMGAVGGSSGSAPR